MATSDQQISNALTEFGGNVSAAARAVRLSRRQLHRRIEQSESLRSHLDDLREMVADFAEATISDAIKGGCVKTAQWYLLSSKVGQKRGYSKLPLDPSQTNLQEHAQTLEIIVDTPEQIDQIMEFQQFMDLASKQAS